MGVTRYIVKKEVPFSEPTHRQRLGIALIEAVLEQHSGDLSVAGGDVDGLEVHTEQATMQVSG